MAKFEDVLENYIGPIGKWQWVTFSVIIFTSVGSTYIYPQLASLLPDHHCRVPSLEMAGWREADIASLAIPQVAVSFLRNGTKLSKCLQYNVSRLLETAENVYQRNLSELNFDQVEALKPRFRLRTVPCQNGWWYDEERSMFRRPFSQEFDMVCERYYIIPLSTSTYIVGAMIGRIIGGFLADQYGRKPVLLAACMLVFVFGILVGVSPTVWLFFVFRFLTGLTGNIAFVIGVVLWSEITNDKYRNIFGVLFEIHESFVVASFYVLLAFLIQDWRILHMAIVIQYGLAVVHICLVTESPRWMLTKGKTKEAWNVILRTIHWNCNEQAFSESTLSDLKERVKFEYNVGPTHHKQSFLDNISMLFCSPLRRTILSFTVIYSVTIMGQLGFSFYAVRLKLNNPYLVAFVGFLLILPAMLVKFLLYHFFRRKRPLVTVLLACAASCIIQAALRWVQVQGWTQAALATFSLGCSFVAQNMVLTFVTECFPTECRNFAVGVCSGCGRLGAVLATYISRLDVLVWAPLPMIVFGVVNIIAAVTVPFIPQCDASGLQDRLHEDTPPESSEKATTYGAPTEMKEMTSRE